MPTVSGVNNDLQAYKWKTQSKYILENCVMYVALNEIALCNWWTQVLQYENSQETSLL